MKLKPLILATLLLSPLANASDIMLHNAYARATPPPAATCAVFVEIMNHSDNDRAIVAAKTPAAGHVELHDVVHEGEMMKMRQIEKIALPAQSHTSLKPGGLHIMLFDLTKPLVEGEKIDVEITFANGETQQFEAPIKKVMSGMKHHH